MKKRILWLALCLALSLILIQPPAFHGGAGPASAKSGASPSGQQCSPADTKKTTICHVPPGHPDQAQTLCVANSALKAHLDNHPGDCIGGCPCQRPVTYSTCAPVTVTQVHGEGFVGNSRLAGIENGKVPCLHVETGEKSECLFSTGQNASGEWIEAADGQYAKTGQAISLLGEPGGEWIVAARVNSNGTVPCVAPSGRDTSGYLEEGTELAGTCVVEEMLVGWNALSAYGYSPLSNYANGEVCTRSNPHPDDAQLTATFVLEDVIGTPTIYCYTGRGAALNDINGTERDGNGTYYPGKSYCHCVRQSGYEVPGAKRPATRSLPAPGSVNINSLILWRPVSPNFFIANVKVTF